MFDSVRNNKKMVQVFLVLITLPFAFWGVESYVRDTGGAADAAKVGDSTISVQEFQTALREQQDRLRQQLGGKLDPAMFETPAMRRAVLDSLVTQRLLTLQARQARLAVTDAQLAELIFSIPQLQYDGKFSKERYAELVAARGMSKEMFEAGLRNDLLLQQLPQAVGDGAFGGKLPAQRWARAQLEQREIAEFRLAPDAYLAKVTVADAAVAAYYEANTSRFELPEQVRADFLVLSQEQISAQIVISEDDIKARYTAKAATYTQAETRRASHILLRADKGAAEADVKAAQAKADELLAQVKAAPNEFARIARENSQDPGSAARGGDLDWFGRGMMVKPFEDTVFALKDGETSGIVRSDFGFHIIRLTGIRAEKVKPLAEVRAELQSELRREQAARRFAETVEAFGNMVYEQPDSLHPAAEKWKLTVQTSPWLPRGGKLPPPFDNAKLAAAVFAGDAVKQRRNTEAVEVAPGILVAARVADHKAAALQPLDVVRDVIRKQLMTEEAATLARKDGEEALARLKRGEQPSVAWGAPRTVLRAAPAGLTPEAAAAVFAVPAANLPGYAGVATGTGGFSIYRVGNVKAPGDDDLRLAALAQQYQRLVADEEFTAWVAALRKRYPVTINSAAIEQKAQ